MLAAAALLRAQHVDFNAPTGAATALLRSAADALDPADAALRACTLARLAITLTPEPAAARAAAEKAVASAREAISREPDGRAPATALATALAAQHHVLWGTQDPRDALADASEIVAAAQRAHEPETELDGHVLRLTHLLELGDGPPAQRVLPELDQLADSLNQPAARLAALSRRSTVAALTGDFGAAAEFARRAFQTGQAAALPDAGAVYWGQMFAIWLHTGLPADDEQRMEQLLRDLVARSHLSVAHAAALVQIDAARGSVEQARGLLDELISTGMDTLRPDMVYVWALTLNREDDFWIIGYAGARTRMPDSLGLRYLDLLGRNPGRELAALELVQLAGATSAAGTRMRAGDLHEVSSADADDVLDQQARNAYRRRLNELGQELAEAEEWNDIERASRLRAEREFLVRELTAATGLGGRSRRLGSASERSRINVTRAIRSAIARIRDRAPDAAAHLDQTVRTGTRCWYSLPYPIVDRPD
jgi:hypothetical protein